jgi:hypothetical protein
VTNDGTSLHAFNERQRIIDSALCDSGVPIDYCYNLTEDYSERNDPIYTLQQSLLSNPADVANELGIISNVSKHFVLKESIDKLLETGSPIGGNISALFSKGILARVRDLNIKALFFCKWNDSFEIYSSEEMLVLFNAFESSVNLASSIDLNTASRDQLVRHLSATRDIWSEYLKDQAMLEDAPHADDELNVSPNEERSSYKRFRI